MCILLLALVPTLLAASDAEAQRRRRGRDGEGAPSASSDPIERARELVREFEYREAVAVLEDFVMREQPPDRELVARQLIVLALASAGDEAAARAAAATLFERDPGYELDDPDRISPRIRGIYVDASRAARARPPARAQVDAQPSGDRVAFRVSVQASAIVDRVEMGVRAGAPAPWQRLEPERRGAVFEATVDRAPVLAYYVRVLAPSGHVVAEAGSEAAPLEHRDVVGSADDGDGDYRDDGADEGGAVADPEGGSALPWILGVGAGVLVVGATVGLLVWQPWAGDGAHATIQLP